MGQDPRIPLLGACSGEERRCGFLGDRGSSPGPSHIAFSWTRRWQTMTRGPELARRLRMACEPSVVFTFFKCFKKVKSRILFCDM